MQDSNGEDDVFANFEASILPKFRIRHCNALISYENLSSKSKVKTQHRNGKDDVVNNFGASNYSKTFALAIAML